jgi:UDP-N-acetylglucosamine 4-epimerase
METMTKQKPIYEMPRDLEDKLGKHSYHWLVTGGAGFIGSHIVETLLNLGQKVTTLDNFSTGCKYNLDLVARSVSAEDWQRHSLIVGDIEDKEICRQACANVDLVIHQAALGSVPRSIADPITTHHANATGFLNMLVSARDARVKRFVYAASSSTYGDSKSLPKVENIIGNPLSPYAVTKYLNELYANVFGSCFGMETIGLRYFNVFGPRQDPNGSYAAVIPKWIGALMNGDSCHINGDGKTSRDFCFVANAVQANLRAGISNRPEVLNQVFNIACGYQTTLNQLHDIISENLKTEILGLKIKSPMYGEFRDGDVRHSLADISKAESLLGYSDIYGPHDGLKLTTTWYANQAKIY